MFDLLFLYGTGAVSIFAAVILVAGLVIAEWPGNEDDE